MDINQVQALIDNKSLPGNCHNAELKETHISWIILTDEFAFKIKRPVHYSFVDFTSLEKRKHFCHQEIILNRRLAPEMYMGILPVTSGMTGKSNRGKEKEIIDYTVQMKRLDNRKEMDILLAKSDVSPEHIDSLSKKISDFHSGVKVIYKPFNPEYLQNLYSDINSVTSYLKKIAGIRWKDKINKCNSKSREFLENNIAILNERVRQGYRKDCHGDLNSRNIFLYDDPVIFDCIEFNDEFRYIDVLNEIAFLCVDLDFFDKNDLSALFSQRYFEYFNIDDDRETRQILAYYKSYRANIRAKVTLISANKKNSGLGSKEIQDAKKYIELMENYCGKF